MMKSSFITFEGLEGSGKSTQVGLLGSKLKEGGREIVVTREPGGTRIGELIRQITHSRENVDLTAASEAYLMAASRAQHLREIIRPAIEAGKIVVCDRYIDSSLAYQGYGRGLGEEEVWNVNKLAVEGVMPDITFFLDVSIDEGIKRRNGTPKIDRLDLQQLDFYQRVHEGYKKLAVRYPDRIRVLDAHKSVSDVSKEIWHIVSKTIT